MAGPHYSDRAVSKPKRNWIQEERRKTLGDWVAFCLACGHTQRYFLDGEERAAGGVPAVRRRAPPSLSGVRGSDPVGLRGRVRGVRNGDSAGRALRNGDSQAGSLTLGSGFSPTSVEASQPNTGVWLKPDPHVRGYDS